ncbi:MAG: peptidoglycan-binding protein LysM [Granulosicoccaceae bacterium]
MGWMDFASDMGRKLFGGDDDPAAKIQEHLEEDNPGVSGLKVEFEDGVAKISGDAADAAAAQKAVLMAGNVEGVTSVDVSGLNGLDGGGGEPKTYVIEKGDTLWAIASAHYGDGNKYHDIVAANKEVIKNADLIFPGQKILIP